MLRKAIFGTMTEWGKPMFKYYFFGVGVSK